MKDVVAVATSGGRDSVALLEATLHAARDLALQVVALHVHHGLQPDADRWLADLQAHCDQRLREGWPVRLHSTRVLTAPTVGESVEAWARRERYAALARMAHEVGASLVLLAHHRRDQAETVLLQALRGAGPAGLAAMPQAVEREGITWARPWLAQPVESIEAYARAYTLPRAIDPSNADPRYLRSRLRAGVMPVLARDFPDAESALAAVARRAHEARCALDEIASEDLAALDTNEDGLGDGLPLVRWRALSAARRANALRAWLARGSPDGIPETLVQRLLAELGDDAPRRWPLDDARELRSWRGHLRVSGAAAPPTDSPEVTLDLDAEGCHEVPGWPGHLEVHPVGEGGVPLGRLRGAVVRLRREGEQFRLRPASTARSLKKQYQGLGIAAEDRGGPHVYDRQGALLYVAGLGMEGSAWAGPGDPQWALRWVSSEPESASSTGIARVRPIKLRPAASSTVRDANPDEPRAIPDPRLD